MDGLWRPFVTAEVGFDGKSSNDNWYWGCTIGVGGGVHAFLFNNFSVDARMMFDMNFGSGEVPVAVLDDGFRQWRFGISGLLGMSVWF